MTWRWRRSWLRRCSSPRRSRSSSSSRPRCSSSASASSAPRPPTTSRRGSPSSGTSAGPAGVPRRHRDRRRPDQARVAADRRDGYGRVRGPVRVRAPRHAARARLDDAAGGGRGDRPVVDERGRPVLGAPPAQPERTALGSRLTAATFVANVGTTSLLTLLLGLRSYWSLPFLAVSLALVLGVPASSSP